MTEAVEVAKAIGGPVKVQWSREDDTQHDFYRPMSVNNVRAFLQNGKLVSLSHQVVQESLLRRWLPQATQNGIDLSSLADVIDIPYRVPNMRVTNIDNENGIPTGSFRAPQANWNDFVTETSVDELANAAGPDPLAFRFALLPADSPSARVLKLAAEMGRAAAARHRTGHRAGLLGRQLRRVGRRRLAAGEDAEGASGGRAVDCGTVVNPDIVAQ